MSDTVQRIKEKLSIVDVVSPYVKLTKAGKYWKGLSPFNKEKTPSFFVSPDRGSYYCFSSGQGGDMFTFTEKMEGVDFKGALKILAEKAGVELVYERKEEHGKTDRLREALARAEQYYAEALDEKSAPYAYARSRGLLPETIRAWRLGYAPDDWRILLERLSADGFVVEELLAAGLVKEAEGKKGTYYDRFRDRLMFPIRDAAGRTVAFTGRALSADEQAKYLNSPETELFKKSSILFGMDRAKDAIRIRGFTILMEGQMDLLHAHQAGFTNAVALSGTALSDTHLALLKRYSENLMLCLDADRAGLAASGKSALAALGSGMRVKAVELPKGKDPADIIFEDPKAFTKLVAEAKPVVEFFLSVLQVSEKDSHHLVLAAERDVLPLVAAIRSPLEREHFVGIVARSLGSTPEAVRQAIPKAVAPPAGQSPAGPAFVAKTTPKETYGLALRAAVENYSGTPLASRIESEYARITDGSLPVEGVPEGALFRSGIDFGEAPDEHAGDELIRRFERAVLDERYAEALRHLRVAQNAKDAAAESAAEKECDNLKKHIASLP